MAFASFIGKYFGRSDPLLFHEPQCYFIDNKCHCSNGRHFYLPPDDLLTLSSTSQSESSEPSLSVTMSAGDLIDCYSSLSDGCSSLAGQILQQRRETLTPSCPDHLEEEEDDTEEPLAPTCPDQIVEGEDDTEEQLAPRCPEGAPRPPPKYEDTNFIPANAFVQNSAVYNDLPPSYDSLFSESSADTPTSQPN
ncbi:hypothetical protein Pcinc_034263 [Petrolisthes cinctipes]|uniref:Uncharacterized protein n=1 Tax=Petrolisthes cinctipes TaxID=88211 RepID=A0AAE1EQM3_PETCI|nr:hypothetical protein Pcinc_034263 [Petrolisthes cinctipes]